MLISSNAYVLVLLRLDSVHLYTVLFFFLLPLSKKILQLLFITGIVSLEMMRKSVTYIIEMCRKEWLLGLHAKRSIVLRITFWDGFPHNHVLTFFETGSSLKKKIDPDPDSEFYWPPPPPRPSRDGKMATRTWTYIKTSVLTLCAWQIVLSENFPCLQIQRR